MKPFYALLVSLLLAAAAFRTVAAGATGVEDALGSREIDSWRSRGRRIGLRQKHQQREEWQHSESIGIVIHCNPSLRRAASPHRGLA